MNPLFSSCALLALTVQSCAGFTFSPTGILFAGLKALKGEDQSQKYNNETVIPLPKPTTLLTPPVQEVEYYVHISAATYCTKSLVKAWTCNECKYDPNTQLIQIVENDSFTLQTFGVITYNPVRQEIIVAYRGSHNIMNFVQDTTYTKVPSPYGEPGIEIHEGFMKSTDSLYPQVLQILQRLVVNYPRAQVALTGHSLGASMALLTFFRLMHDLPNGNYALYTFGEPRTGNQAFADWVNSQRIKAARVVNEGDLVPHAVSAGFGYAHRETEYWTHYGTTKICSNVFYEDPMCSNSLGEAYTFMGHLNYMGTSIGLNCIDENFLGSAWDMMTGKK